MKYKMHAALLSLIVCIASLSIAGAASAGNGGPGQNEPAIIAIWSRTDMNTVADAELAAIYREADESLMDQVRGGLAKRGMRVSIAQSDKDIIADTAEYVLLIKLDKIELGGKRPFGRTARVKVAYTVQNKIRHNLVKRTHEETSASKWQNCVKKISDQLVLDVSNDIVRNSGTRDSGDKQESVKQASGASTAEARLQQLENLKAKGLISPEEYATKRKELLNEL